MSRSFAPRSNVAGEQQQTDPPAAAAAGAAAAAEGKAQKGLININV